MEKTSAEHPILAIDHGEARIGLAATDDFALSVHPVETVAQGKDDVFARLKEIARQRKTATLVLGLPLRMDGSEGDSAAKVRTFGQELREALPDIPLFFHDERLSTVSAAEKLHQSGKNARRQKKIIDQAAAMEILRDFLGW